VNHFLKNESRFWKNHGKLAHEQNLAPKIIPNVDIICGYNQVM
jgi:hypothetical protein